jgi:hypothetical protein
MTEEFHPIANIWPLLGEEELDKLAADIAANGLRTPIWRHKDGRIVDGRNRWLACRKAGVPCPHQTFEQGDPQLIPFLISLNERRRHLNESQRAMVAARLATLVLGSNQHRQKEGGSIEPPSEPVETQGISTPEAAALLKISPESVKRGRRVLREGSPDMVAAIEEGRDTVHGVVTRLAAAKPKLGKAKDAVRKGKGGKTAAAAGKKRFRRRAIPAIEQRPPELVRFTLWLRNGPEIFTTIGEPHEAISWVIRSGMPIDWDAVDRVAEFMAAFAAAVKAGRAA